MTGANSVLPNKLKKEHCYTNSWMVIIFLTVYTIIQIYPLIWLIFFSLKDNDQIFSGSALGLPTIFRWENYIDVFVNLSIITPLINSIIVTAATIIFTILFSSMAAYGALRLGCRYGKQIIMYFTIGIMIPVHAALLPLFLVFRNLHILNSYYCLIISYTAFAIPQATFIMSGFIQGIPKDLDEAARIDGCSEYRLFFSIIFPLLRPIIATVSIFVFLSSWNELMFSMVFNSKNALRTLTVAILSYQSDYFINWGVIGAAMVIALLPTLVIYFIFSDQIQKSLMSGAVKG